MSDAPNVLLVVVDSLRYDATFDRGDWATDTPAIDRLADEGVRFDHCVSQGISTAPAMTAMLTGRYPLDYGGHWSLADDQPTFAQEFRRGGYATGAVHSNPYVSSRRNFDRGFDTFHEDTVAFEPDRGLEGTPEKLLRLANRLSRVVSRRPYTPADEVNDTVLEFVDGAAAPWFCWAQYMDVHGPYLGGGDPTYLDKVRGELLWRKAAVRSPEAVTDAEHERLRRSYRLEVEYLDEQFGALLDALAGRDVLDETVVILTADHGDEFREHGRYGHGNLPYAELVCVPLVVRFPPGHGVDGTRVGGLVRSLDVLPTALDYAGVPLGDAMRERLEGRSLRPLIEGDVGGDGPATRHAITEKRVRGSDALRIGVRSPDWSFLFDGTDESTALYDLREDPGEQEDVIDEHPERRDEFLAVLESRLDRIDETSAGVSVPAVEESAGVEERLRALGYRE
jgi:arylsulfatase A-like enzyme